MSAYETLMLVLFGLLVWNTKVGFSKIIEQLKIRNDIMRNNKNDM